MTLSLRLPHPTAKGFTLRGSVDGIDLYACEGCGAFEQPIPNGCDLPQFPHSKIGDGERCPYDEAP